MDRQTVPNRAYGATNTPSDVDINTTAVVTPVDRVRWGPIFAGLFAALSTLAVLAVLGLAVGLSSYDASEPARNFGIGAGVWGAISALIAFFIGGWLASYTAAVRGRWGMLNGAMVWVVAIPLLLYLIAGGVGTLLNTASNVASGAAANPAIANPANLPGGQAGAQNPAAGDQGQVNPQNANPATGGQDAGATGNQGTTGNTAPGQNVTPQQAEDAARSAGAGAWGVLLSLVLGFLASSFGGWLGARRTTYMEPQTLPR